MKLASLFLPIGVAFFTVILAIYMIGYELKTWRFWHTAKCMTYLNGVTYEYGHIPCYWEKIGSGKYVDAQVIEYDSLGKPITFHTAILKEQKE